MALMSAISGDVIGSVYESNPIYSLDFDLLTPNNSFTDDTVIIIAVADWLISGEHTEKKLVECLQNWGNKYPAAGYGGMFRKWLQSDNPQPYQSIGNGAALRGIPIGHYAKSLAEAERLAMLAAQVTHDTADGINAAMAVASTIWMRNHGCSVGAVKEHLKKNYFYSTFNAEDYNTFRNNFKGSIACDDSVPPAIACGLNYHLEDAIRHAVALGYDSDTMACIAGGICRIEPNDFTDKVYKEFLTEDIREVVDAFNETIE